MFVVLDLKNLSTQQWATATKTSKNEKLVLIASGKGSDSKLQ